MVRILITLTALLFSQLSFALSQVTASIDKNPVMINESFVLTVVANDSINANALDTSALHKSFIVGNTSVQNQTSIVNGRSSKSTTFTTGLIAQKKGKLTIPSLNVAGHATQAIALEVLDKADPNAPKNKDIFITSDISSNEVYVQEQLSLVVKLYFSTELQRASLSAPELANANIQQIGKDNEDQTVLNGVRYRVIERTYAINPQQSGEFTIKPPVFSGEVVVNTNRRSSFMSYGQTKPVSVIGDTIALTVKPIPTSYQGQWLPSELLILSEEWQPEPDAFMVGEPITRTITLTAAGLSEEQLPELTIEMPKGLKVYPEQAQLHTGINKSKIVSQKVRNFAIVATKPGSYTLPEVVIPWWNTVTNRMQQATLPARTITVKANPDFSVSPLTQASENTTEPTECEEDTLTVTTATKPSQLQWLFLGLWLVTLFAWFVSARYNKNRATQVKTQPAKLTNDSYNKLLEACKNNNGQAALALIVPWCNALYGDKNNVATLDEALKQLNDQALEQAISSLQQSYFSKEEQSWSGKELAKTIKQLTIKKNADTTNKSFSINP